MTFAGPGKGDDELEAGIAAGATISVESEGEAQRAILAAERRGVRPKIAVRVNPPFAIEDGRVTMGARPSPFGIDAERVPARGPRPDRSRRRLARPAHLRRRAMPRCLGADRRAQGDHRLRRRDRRASSACRFPSSTSAAASTSPASPGEEPLDIYHIAAALHETLCNGPELLATTRLSLELGRWLVGESGVYLTRVLDRTESCGETFLTTDGGGHHLLRATGCLLERNRGNYPIAVANRFGAPRDEQVTVTGCLCHAVRRARRRGHAAPRRARRPDRRSSAPAPTASRPAHRPGRAARRRAKCSSRGRSPRRNRGRAAGR